MSYFYIFTFMHLAESDIYIYIAYISMVSDIYHIVLNKIFSVLCTEYSLSVT